MKEIKRIGVFTSGGDSPGMNAAIRAVVRASAFYDLHVYGIQKGYEGMIEGEINRLEPSDTANIIQRGGTILKTSRSQRFLEPDGRKIAYENLVANDIDALVAIGGNGTFADAHNRLFLVEVMGRHSGYIALYTAIASGASAFLIPEAETTIDGLVEMLQKSLRRKKLFGLIIVAEGNHIGDSAEIAKQLRERAPQYDIKVTTIGHLQRGGSPSNADRILASRLGYEAVTSLMNGEMNCMAGIVNGELALTKLGCNHFKLKQQNCKMIVIK